MNNIQCDPEGSEQPSSYDFDELIKGITSRNYS